MEKAQKKRSEIDQKYQWDLTPIYSDDEKWHLDFDIMKEEIKNISSYKGKIVKNADNLLQYLETYYLIERKLYRLYFYAHLHLDSDTADTKYQQMKGKIDNLMSEFDELNSFSNPELMTIDYKTIQKFYKKEPKLKEYEHVLENRYRFKKHILSKEGEHIVSSLSLALDNASETYEFLTDTDMKFGNIVLEDGEQIELTESNYPSLIKANNREVRKQAFERLLGTYGNYKNTLASTFSGNVKTLSSLAKIKNYDSSIKASLFDDNVDVKVYNTLIETVHEHMDVIYKYFDLKKEALNLEELHLYDIYVEMIKDLDKTYTFEEGKDLVLKSLAILGEDYVSNLNKAFDEKWIDVYNNTGKRGGAYSSGYYDINPYILLNYENKLKDVSTLAHELGHSMHSYYSHKNNTYQNSSYKIFVAEVASTTNELLLNHYLLKNSNDDNEKMYILNSMMELFKGTIYRQTMFAEFERNCHQKYENGEVLTYELLNSDYYELNKQYFGKNVVIDDEIKQEWERIPHFYYNFYVYKYAIGLSCACYIVDGILNGRKNALNDYLSFLKSGGSDYPINELKIAGIDVTDKLVVESALKMFDQTIEDFKKLYNK